MTVTEPLLIRYIYDDCPPMEEVGYIKIKPFTNVLCIPHEGVSFMLDSGKIVVTQVYKNQEVFFTFPDSSLYEVVSNISLSEEDWESFMAIKVVLEL